jgi:pseudouridine synthase
MHSKTHLKIRIHVYLARLGFGSRREIESWVREGKVYVNGRKAVLGQLIDPHQDQMKVKGKLVGARPVTESMVLALHKPRGVLSTAKDPEGRETVMRFLPPKPRLFSIGRLDLNSEGLLLFTNDGDLAHQLMHPKFEVPKIYEVKVRGNFDQKKKAHLEKGMLIGNERFKGAEILDVRDVTRQGMSKFKIQIKVFEGKNHHVRKLFQALQCHVVKLKRISFGPIALKGIPLGEYRKLTRTQVDRLKCAAQIGG